MRLLNIYKQHKENQKTEGNILVSLRCLHGDKAHCACQDKNKNSGNFAVRALNELKSWYRGEKRNLASKNIQKYHSEEKWTPRIARKLEYMQFLKKQSERKLNTTATTDATLAHPETNTEA